MANRLTTATIRGIAPTALRWRPENLAPNDGATLNSDFTEKDPRPGTAVATDEDARLVPEISNAQSTDLEIRVTEAGLPGPEGAAVSYKKTSEPADFERGWNQPNLFAGWVDQEFTDTFTLKETACVTIPSTQEVVALALFTPTPLRSRVFDSETWTWSAATTLPTFFEDEATALCVLRGSEKVLAILLGSVSIAMRVFATDDKGTTWERYSDRPIRESTAAINGSGFADTLRAKAVALDDGSILAVVQEIGAAEDVAQIASSDLGSTFRLVETVAVIGTDIDVIRLPDDSIGFAYIAKTTHLPSIKFIGSPSDSLTSAATVLIDAVVDLRSMTTTIDADGAMYVVGTERFTEAKTFAWLSTDFGQTWTKFDKGVIETGDGSTFPIFLGSCSSGGHTLVQHNWSATPGNEDESVGTMILGGWSNLSMGVRGAATYSQFERFAYGASSTAESNTWFPIELPQDTIYTLTGTTGVLTAGEMEIITVAALSDHAFTQTTTLGDQSIMGQFRVDSGGSQVTAAVGWRSEISNAAIRFAYQIRADTVGFAVFDVHAASDVGTETLDMTTDIQIKVEVTTLGALVCFFRRPGATRWTAGPSGSLTDGGAGAATSSINWGHIGSTSSTSHWRMFPWGFESQLNFGAGLVDGKRIAAAPYPLLEVGDSVTLDKAFLALRSGPGVLGELYDIPNAPDRAVERMFPTVSPFRDDTFETTGTALTRVAVDLVEDTRLGISRTLVLGVLNSNVKEIRLLAQVGAAYSTIGTWNGAVGFEGLAYILDGDMLRPDTATTIDAGRWLQAMEKVGGTALLPSGKARTILSHSGGGWTQKTTQRPEIRLAGIDGTEDVTGVCDLVSPSGVLVVHLDTANHQRYAIEIAAAQSTVSGRYSIGVAPLGSLIVPGKTWSNGWTYSVVPNFRARSTPAGTEFREQLGEERRELSIAWPDGVKFSFIRGSLDVDFIAPSGGEPLAGRDDSLFQMIALMREAKGFSLPVMVLSDVPDASGVTITDPTLWLYGYVEGTVSAAHVTGDEGVREFARLEGLKIVETR